MSRLTVLSILVPLLLASGCGSSDARGPENWSARDAVTKVSAEDLALSFKDGEAAGQAKYGQRSLLVTGTIKSVKPGFNGTPFIQFEGAGGLAGATAMFAESTPPSTLSLVDGKQAIVLCRTLGLIMDVPTLGGCASR